MADQGRQLGVPEDDRLESGLLGEDSPETSETPAISKNEGITRKALIALLALGAVVAIPKESNAYSLVTAWHNKIYVILNAQNANGEITPDLTYEVPMNPGGYIGQVEVLSDNKLVVLVGNQNGSWDVKVLEFDGNSFDVSGAVHFDPWVTHYGTIEVAPDGNVLVTRSDGTYKFNPDDPEGTLETLIDDDNLFKTSVSFTDGNGVQCHLVTSEEGGLQLIADGPNGSNVTNIPLPPAMAEYPIRGLKRKGNILTLTNSGDIWSANLSTNNPLALMDDINNYMTIQTRDEMDDSVSWAGHTGQEYLTLDSSGNMAFINKTDTEARDSLNVGSNSGLVPYDSNGDGIDETFFVRGGDDGVANNYSVSIVDGDTKEVTRGLTGQFGTLNGLAVIADNIPSELRAQFESNTPINGIKYAVSPSVTVAPANDGNDMEVTVSADALLSEDAQFYFEGPTQALGGPEPQENIIMHVGDYDVLITGFGTAGGVSFDKQSGDLDGAVTGEFEIFEQGLLKAQPSRIVVEDYELVEGSNGREERVLESFDFGTFGEVTGRNEAGDDDDATHEADDDDTAIVTPDGCNCSLSATKQPNGAWLISFVLGAAAAGRRRRVRIVK